MNKFNTIKDKDSTYYISNKLSFDKKAEFYEDFFNIQKIKNLPNTQTRGGRGQTLLYSLNDLDLVLRHYKRGGLFGKIIKDSFFCFEAHAHRARDEFMLLERMQELNLPVPKAVIAREIEKGPFIKSDIVIQRLIGYRDLSYVIRERELSKEELQAIGRTIKIFFDKNIKHTDLNIRNILIDDKANIVIIDFDKCFEIKLSRQDKMNIVARLLRSFKKEQVKYQNENIHFNETDFKLLEEEALA